MAISVEELIGKKDEIKAKKAGLYDLETSIGDITVKMPTSKIVADAWAFNSSMEGNIYLVLECTVAPNLKDSQLQKAYGVGEPTEIVPAVFQVGEITRIASTILELAGYKENIKFKIHNEIKNS